MARLAGFPATIAFLLAAFFDATGLEAALADADFETTLFPAADFLPAADFFAGAAFLLADRATSGAAPIRNLERSFALASHAGAGPRPLHVAPVFGSWYLGGCLPLGFPAPVVASEREAILPRPLGLPAPEASLA